MPFAAASSDDRSRVDLEKQSSSNPSVSGDCIVNVNEPVLTGSTFEHADGSSPTKTKKELRQAKLEAEEEINRTITIPLQNYPHGYPLQAAFQSSESSFSIYRAFSYLHSRVILELQDELRILEKDLSRLDTADNNDYRSHCLTSRSGDANQAKLESKPCSSRRTLLETIRNKLVSYDEVLVKARELNAFQRPSKRDYRSLRRWFHSKAPLSYAPEEEFIMRKEDLITLRQGREWAGFDGWVEGRIHKLPNRVSKFLFTTPELREKSNDPFQYYYSPSRVEKLVSFLITFIVFILLVIPVVVMYKLTSVGERHSMFDAVGILVVFTSLFSAAMSLLTKAQRHELFAASAAYCAVLVVFISNFDREGGRR